MKITSILTHYVRIPFDMGAPRQEFAGLRFEDGNLHAAELLRAGHRGFDAVPEA